MLREIHPGLLWVAEQPFSKFGFEVGARMTVVRLPDGGLWLHSPITPEPELRHALDALGPVKYLVAPSGMHTLDLPLFAGDYPEAEVYAAPGAADKLRGVKADGILGDQPPPPWVEVLDQVVLRGNRLYDEVDFVHHPSRTLILTDLCFNIHGGSTTTALWSKLMGIHNRFVMSRSFAWTVSDREAVRASLERLLAWDFDRVIVSHGEVLESGGKEAFRRACARYLTPPSAPLSIT